MNMITETQKSQQDIITSAASFFGNIHNQPNNLQQINLQVEGANKDLSVSLNDSRNESNNDILSNLSKDSHQEEKTNNMLKSGQTLPIYQKIKQKKKLTTLDAVNLRGAQLKRELEQKKVIQQVNDEVEKKSGEFCQLLNEMTSINIKKTQRLHRIVNANPGLFTLTKIDGLNQTQASLIETSSRMSEFDQNTHSMMEKLQLLNSNNNKHHFSYDNSTILNLTSGFNIVHMPPVMQETQKNLIFLTQRKELIAKELETIYQQIIVQQTRREGLFSMDQQIDQSKNKFLKSINELQFYMNQHNHEIYQLSRVINHYDSQNFKSIQNQEFIEKYLNSDRDLSKYQLNIKQKINDEQKSEIKKEINNYNQIISEIDFCQQQVASTSARIKELDVQLQEQFSNSMKIIDLIQNLDYFDQVVEIFIEGDPSQFIDINDENATNVDQYLKPSHFMDQFFSQNENHIYILESSQNQNDEKVKQEVGFNMKNQDKQHGSSSKNDANINEDYSINLPKKLNTNNSSESQQMKKISQIHDSAMIRIKNFFEKFDNNLDLISNRLINYYQDMIAQQETLKYRIEDLSNQKQVVYEYLLTVEQELHGLLVGWDQINIKIDESQAHNTDRLRRMTMNQQGNQQYAQNMNLNINLNRLEEEDQDDKSDKYLAPLDFDPTQDDINKINKTIAKFFLFSNETLFRIVSTLANVKRLISPIESSKDGIEIYRKQIAEKTPQNPAIDHQKVSYYLDNELFISLQKIYEFVINSQFITQSQLSSQPGLYYDFFQIQKVATNRNLNQSRQGQNLLTVIDNGTPKRTGGSGSEGADSSAERQTTSKFFASGSRSQGLTGFAAAASTVMNISSINENKFEKTEANQINKRQYDIATCIRLSLPKIKTKEFQALFDFIKNDLFLFYFVPIDSLRSYLISILEKLPHLRENIESIEYFTAQIHTLQDLGMKNFRKTFKQLIEYHQVVILRIKDNFNYIMLDCMQLNHDFQQNFILNGQKRAFIKNQDRNQKKGFFKSLKNQARDWKDKVLARQIRQYQYFYQVAQDQESASNRQSGIFSTLDEGGGMVGFLSEHVQDLAMKKKFEQHWQEHNNLNSDEQNRYTNNLYHKLRHKKNDDKDEAQINYQEHETLLFMNYQMKKFVDEKQYLHDTKCKKESVMHDIEHDKQTQKEYQRIMKARREFVSEESIGSKQPLQFSQTIYQRKRLNPIFQEIMLQNKQKSTKNILSEAVSSTTRIPEPPQKDNTTTVQLNGGQAQTFVLNIVDIDQSQRYQNRQKSLLSDLSKPSSFRNLNVLNPEAEQIETPTQAQGIMMIHQESLDQLNLVNRQKSVFHDLLKLKNQSTVNFLKRQENSTRQENEQMAHHLIEGYQTERNFRRSSNPEFENVKVEAQRPSNQNSVILPSYSQNSTHEIEISKLSRNNGSQSNHDLNFEKKSFLNDSNSQYLQPIGENGRVSSTNTDRKSLLPEDKYVQITANSTQDNFFVNSQLIDYGNKTAQNSMSSSLLSPFEASQSSNRFSNIALKNDSPRHVSNQDYNHFNPKSLFFNNADRSSRFNVFNNEVQHEL